MDYIRIFNGQDTNPGQRGVKREKKGRKKRFVSKWIRDLFRKWLFLSFYFRMLSTGIWVLSEKSYTLLYIHRLTECGLTEDCESFWFCIKFIKYIKTKRKFAIFTSWFDKMNNNKGIQWFKTLPSIDLSVNLN